MAKLYYNRSQERYEVAAWNPQAKQIEVIDHDQDLEALGIRQGLISEDEPEEFDPLAESDE